MRFAENALLVGHNVLFDLRMAAGQARRLGISWPGSAWADTWDIACRYLDAPDYHLGTLVAALGLPVQPAHRALDDARMTADVLLALLPRIAAGAAQRTALVRRYGKPFRELAEQLAGWRAAAEERRPHHLLWQVLEESGLLAHYADDERRQGHLARLHNIFVERDDPSLAPATALRAR